LAAGAATVARAVQLQPSSVVLVGHSWGGAVVTQAGLEDKVAALVYVAAFAPDVGQSTNDLQAAHPAPAYLDILKIDADGFLWFPQQFLPEWFAHDLPRANADVLAAVQAPIRATAFDDKVTACAWRAKRRWYLVTESDRMIAPTLQREMANRMHAHIGSVKSSHVPFLSRPRETTDFISAAASHAGAAGPFI
jgi:pimeloyl-ACP methyl ester carboxylesterase